MKQSTDTHTLRRWELALLLGLALAALLGVWLDKSQSALADQVIRLHVLANSDSQADQALKLKVRDSVLAAAETYFQPGATRDETEAVLREHLWELASAGAETVAAEGYDGQYTALRIVIGEGGGQNWWCVVFPPLCLGSVTESTAQTALSAGLSEDQVSLMTGEDEGYVVKFRALVLWESFQHWLWSQ